ncbi:MAG: N-acetylmuramoyl-L-alanine amidase [Roseiflexaceae bacterium]|nr:N-acetylmuramoyl-L-alanine amidase [Roseiflexaceae bacterium]
MQRAFSAISGMLIATLLLAIGESVRTPVDAHSLAAIPAASQAQKNPTLTPNAEPYRSPIPLPTPTPRPIGVAPRVAIQVGHWNSDELPDELARLRTSTGGHSDGYAEVDLNLLIAKRVEKLLTQRGIVVDVLPATVPPNYDADAFVALHADGSTSRGARGYKVATPWRTSRAAQQLSDAIEQAYGNATGLPLSDAITFNMRGYYAFSFRRHTHAVARTTPAVILEMGYLTNAADRAFMYGRADTVAAGITNGIMDYLNTRDPNDGAALLPPDFPMYRIATNNVPIRSAPRDDARILLRANLDQRLMPFQEKNGWLEVVVRGEWRVVGWVRMDAVLATNEAPPTPPPATDGS